MNVSANIGQRKSASCSARLQRAEVERLSISVVRAVITAPYGMFGIWIAL